MATLGIDDEAFSAAFEARLRSPDGLFKGPYLRLGLPFASAGPGEQVPLAIAPPFTPYAHQLQAFRQLDSQGGEDCANTLVTTGTGSGKTECFLYPILDHCHRNRDRGGIQAIIIYPMNALATDQARRLAQIIDGDDRLRGNVTAGLYVGGGDKELPTQMSPTRLIENKRRIIDDPPHILLTNYKMLDFMLLRPNERRMWQHNGPETLQYLVVDELHTFDGAQGSDVACLIRRLKARLSIPIDHLLCSGTSATIGSSTDPATFASLAAFAETVFGEPFEPSKVVREKRLALHEFQRAPGGQAPLPAQSPELLSSLRPGTYVTPELWRNAQRSLWLDSAVDDPVALGQSLLAHPFLHALLAVMDGEVHTLAQIDAGLAEHIGPWASLPVELRQALLVSFIGIISEAKRDIGGHQMPLLAVQLQLWARELTRLMRELPDQAEGTELPPRAGTHMPNDAGQKIGDAQPTKPTAVGLFAKLALRTLAPSVANAVDVMQRAKKQKNDGK